MPILLFSLDHYQLNEEIYLFVEQKDPLDLKSLAGFLIEIEQKLFSD